MILGVKKIDNKLYESVTILFLVKSQSCIAYFSASWLFCEILIRFYSLILKSFVGLPVLKTYRNDIIYPTQFS